MFHCYSEYSNVSKVLLPFHARGHFDAALSCAWALRLHLFHFRTYIFIWYCQSMPDWLLMMWFAITEICRTRKDKGTRTGVAFESFSRWCLSDLGLTGKNTSSSILSENGLSSIHCNSTFLKRPQPRSFFPELSCTGQQKDLKDAPCVLHWTINYIPKGRYSAICPSDDFTTYRIAFIDWFWYLFPFFLFSFSHRYFLSARPK